MKTTIHVTASALVPCQHVIAARDADAERRGLHGYMVGRVADVMTSWNEVEYFVDQLRSEVLVRALERTGGLQMQAARDLRMPFRTMRYRIAAHDITITRFARIE